VSRHGVLRRALAGVLLMPLVGVVAGNVGCQRSEEDADVLPPVGLSNATTQPVVTSPLGPVRFGQGWYPIESNAQGSWRWMGQMGEIHVPTTTAKTRLKISGWAPLELLSAPPTMRVSVNGKEIDRFAPPLGRFKKEYDVAREAASDQPETLVRLETSATANAPNDPRALGFALVSVVWAPVP